MYRKFLAILFLLLGPFQVALAKDASLCKGVHTESDAFGVMTRGTVIYVGIGGYLAVAVRQIGEDKHLQVLWVQRGVVDTTMPAGTVGKVALGDGTVLELASAKDAPPIANHNDSTTFTQWIVEFPLSPDLLSKLAAAPITAVQSSIAGQQVQFEVPAKKAPKLQAAAACTGSN